MRVHRLDIRGDDGQRRAGAGWRDHGDRGNPQVRARGFKRSGFRRRQRDGSVRRVQAYHADARLDPILVEYHAIDPGAETRCSMSKTMLDEPFFKRDFKDIDYRPDDFDPAPSTGVFTQSKAKSTGWSARACCRQDGLDVPQTMCSGAGRRRTSAVCR